MRRVIKFRLVPTDEFFDGERTRRAEDLAPGLAGSYRQAEEDPKTEQREPLEVDPDAIDRALEAHSKTQNAVAEFIESRGLRAISPELGDPPFDVGWWSGTTFNVAEVKSLSKRNETGQLRLGLGQVLDYHDVLRRAGHNVQSVLAVEKEPTDGRWLGLCAAHGVLLVWPGALSTLVTDAARDGPEPS